VTDSFWPHQPRSEDDELLRVVRSVRNRWRLRVVLRGAAIALLTGLGLVLAGAWAIDAFRFDQTAIMVVRLVSYLAWAGVVGWVVVRPLLRRVSDERVALYLEEHEPSLDGRVVSAVACARSGDPVSAALLVRLVASAVDECHRVDDGRRVERPGLRQMTGLVAGSTVFGLGLFLLGPGFFRQAAPVIVAPWKAAAARNPYRVQVTPGDTVLPRGADLRIQARLENFTADAVDLVVKTGADGDWERFDMLVEDSTSGHTIMLFGLTDATEYFVEAAGVRSPSYTIDVVELPYVDRIDVSYAFPGYTGLDPLEQEDAGDIAAVEGTVATIAVTPTIPVPAGVIVVNDRDTIPLAGSGGRLAGRLTVREPGSYRILLQGPRDRLVTASPDYLIDVFTDQPPILSFAKPGRDLTVTSLEEVAAEVSAQDDYGVRSVELVYSVNGGAERIDTLYGGGGRKEIVAGHTFFLEEYGLVPGDLISYYARARDGHGAGQETVSDIYFMEVRPFDRDYRQADQAPQQGGAGMSGSDLSSQQRQIIAATFKLVRDRDQYGDTDYRENLSTVALSQGRLREEVLRLAERLVSRGVVASDSGMRAIADLLPQAAEAMTRAEEQLGEHHPKDAMPPEQEALQKLQQAEAVFRDVQVAQGQQGGGGQGGEISEELSDLFELELDRLSNQYEQVQRGNRESVDNTIDETLQKLQELARRQQQEVERSRARAQAQSRQQAGSGGGSQRQLAQEAEEVARRLERLAREESLPEMAESARKLREAAEQMRRAAASGESSGEAMGNSALDQLREAERLLERSKAGRLERDTKAALDRAAELRAQEERMVDRVGRLDRNDPGYGEALSAIMRAKEQMAGEVGDLEADLDQLSRDSRRDQPETSRKLQEAAKGIRDDQLRERFLYSRGVVQQRSGEYATNFEEDIAGRLRALEERLREASDALGTTREDRLQATLDRTRQTVTALQSIQDRLRQGEEARQAEQAGERGAAEGGNPQEGQQGAAEGEGNATGERQTTGEDGGRATPGGQGPAVGSGRLQAQDYRQLSRDLSRRRQDLQALRDQLRQEGVEPGDLDRIINRLRGLESAGALANGESAAILQRDIVEGLMEFEFGLRRTLGVGEDRLNGVGSDKVPAGYEELVEEYYKALGRTRR